MASFVEQLRAASAPFSREPEGIRKLEIAEKIKQQSPQLSPGEIVEQHGQAARRGTLIKEYDPYSNPANLILDKDVMPFIDIQVAQESDRLNKVLDDYDKAPTWEDKISIIEDGYKKFQSKTPAMENWFDNIARLTQRAMDPNDDYSDTPENISKAMRSITQSVVNRFFKKS